jgi:hypothetical protein
MVGCNCATAGSSVDLACCSVDGDELYCEPVKSRNYYCGFCERGLAAVGCHAWVPACELQKRLVRLSIVRFKLQTGRDSVFTALQDLNIRRFSTYERFPAEMVVDLNNPRLFASLVSLVSAASFKDRLGEKTKSSFDRWSYDDALTAFHKSLGTIKKTIKSMVVSRRLFEERYSLQWLPAGTSVIRLGDSPTLYALDRALSDSCLHPYATGAFFVLKDSSSDSVPIDAETLSYPNKSWNAPLECDGAVAIPRANGNLDIYEYHYSCRKFNFVGPVKNIPGSLADLKKMLDAYKAQVLLTDSAACPSWVDKFLETVEKHIEANKKRIPTEPPSQKPDDEKPVPNPVPVPDPDTPVAPVPDVPVNPVPDVPAVPDQPSPDPVPPTDEPANPSTEPEVPPASPGF